LNKDRIKKKLFFLGFSILISFISLYLFLPTAIVPGYKEFKRYLLMRLTRIEPLPDISSKTLSKSNNILYILGGPQKSLMKKFKIAADLYHRGLCKKVLFFSNPGITEHSPSLGRNLTYDEWAVIKLAALGVSNEDIEPVVFKKGCFGTLTEAKGISDIAANRGYNQVILVTSHYHTARTWLTFSKMLAHRNVILFIYATDEPVGLLSIIDEYFKLVLYEYLVLPMKAEETSMKPQVIQRQRQELVFCE
jgi:hypothetical protein